MKKNPYKGKFIAFEGLDGSGQTTQANLSRDYLIKEGVKVILTKEPTKDSEAGKKIRKALNKEIAVSPIRLRKLFVEDRDWHQKNIIIPNLKKGKLVITDRSQFSSFAFGTAHGVDLNYIIKLNDKFIEPDLVILLKTSPRTSLERIKKRGEDQTLFEKEKQLEKVWQVYEKLAKRFKNIIIVDGEKTIEEIHKKIRQIIKRVL